MNVPVYLTSADTCGTIIDMSPIPSINLECNTATLVTDEVLSGILDLTM